MAEIRLNNTGFLFGEMAMRIPGECVPSVPSISIALFEQVVVLAAEKYNRPLRRITPRLLRKSTGISPDTVFADRGTVKIYADIVVSKIEGKKVTFDLNLGLDAFAPGVIESLLQFILAHLPDDSALDVKGNAFVGEILLPDEPLCIPTPHNGGMYFLRSEREAIVAFVTREFAPNR